MVQMLVNMHTKVQVHYIHHLLHETLRTSANVLQLEE